MFNRKSQQILETLVPGQPPIELVSWYKKFRQYYPTCEMQSKRWMAENIKEDWVCLDAGANIGGHSILMARLASQGTVHSFEPMKTFSMLEDNVKHSRLDNLVLNRTALGSSSQKKGRDKLFRIWGQRPESYSGKWTTVDEYMKSQATKRMDFLKVDVDGFDFEVLHGAKESISTFRPTVLVEINHASATRDKTASDIFAFMLGQKYSRALVLDSDNYVFLSTWTIGDPWPSELTLEFDFRDALEVPEDAMELSGNSRSVPPIFMRTHNKTKLSRNVYETLGPAWQYSLEVSQVRNWARGKAVQVEVEVHSGQLGIFFSDSRGKKILSRERLVSTLAPKALVFHNVPNDARLMIFRKTTEDDLRFTLSSLRVGVPTSLKLKQEVPTDEPRFNSSKSARVHLASGRSKSLELSNRIPTVGLKDLSLIFQIEAPRFDFNLKSRYDTWDHTMEREDSPYLRWIWSALKPEKHFEFGTWEGFGACLVLKSTNAHVWTINLAQGEQTNGGAQYTESREPGLKTIFMGDASGASDSDNSVGWMYRALELGSRVTQLFGDSLKLDHSSLGNGSFDTVFIDGGHDFKVVSSDQAKALEMLRPGGVVVWHDFSLDDKVIADHPSCKGVLSAVSENIDLLESHLDLYWLEGTFLLIGHKRPSSRD